MRTVSTVELDSSTLLEMVANCFDTEICAKGTPSAEFKLKGKNEGQSLLLDFLTGDILLINDKTGHETYLDKVVMK